MIFFHIHEDAEEDLRKLFSIDEAAFKAITLLLSDLDGDVDLLDRLNQHGYGAYGAGKIDVSEITSLQQLGENFWRLKTIQYENCKRFRILYCYVPKIVLRQNQEHYTVLAIVDRNTYNYQPNHEITKRIRKAYRELV